MKFISFGCWNKGDPDNPNLPLTWLYEKLNEIIREQKDIDFIMITGDNYYYHHKDEGYDKTEKQLRKIDLSFNNQVGGGSDYCNTDDLKSSFDKLNKVKVPIFMCAGNHEYKEHKVISHDDKEESPAIEEPSEPSKPSKPSEPQSGDKIDLLYHEKELLEKKKGKPTGNRFIVQGEFKQNTQDVLFYVIDTTNFDDKLVITVPANKTKLYIFGHVPILSLKHIDKKERVKKGKTKKAERGEWQCLSTLVQWFYDMKLPERLELYYVCADTHNYQEIDITLSNGRIIHQVVVGSGGTFDMDQFGDRKIITSKKDDKYEFIPCKDEKLDKLIGRVRVLTLTGLHGVCLFDTVKKENHHIPYFDAELGLPIQLSKASAKKKKGRGKKNKRKTKRKSRRTNTKKNYRRKGSKWKRSMKSRNSSKRTIRKRYKGGFGRPDGEDMYDALIAMELDLNDGKRNEIIEGLEFEKKKERREELGLPLTATDAECEAAEAARQQDKNKEGREAWSNSSDSGAFWASRVSPRPMRVVAASSSSQAEKTGIAGTRSSTSTPWSKLAQKAKAFRFAQTAETSIPLTGSSPNSWFQVRVREWPSLQQHRQVGDSDIFYWNVIEHEWSQEPPSHLPAAEEWQRAQFPILKPDTKFTGQSYPAINSWPDEKAVDEHICEGCLIYAGGGGGGGSDSLPQYHEIVSTNRGEGWWRENKPCTCDVCVQRQIAPPVKHNEMLHQSPENTHQIDPSTVSTAA